MIGRTLEYRWFEFTDRAGTHRVVLYYPTMTDDPGYAADMGERFGVGWIDMGVPLGCEPDCPFCT